MKTKKSLLLLASVVAAASMSAAIGFTTVSANDAPKTTPDSLGLAAGASVCFGTETVGNGLRYTLEMNKTEYQSFMAAGYTDVTFGVLIAPEFYQTKYGAFNEENVFGANEKTPVYGWATWNDDTDEWNKYEGSAVQIINLSTDELVEFTAESTTTVKYKASVTNLAEASISGEFRGVGYVTYKDGDTQKYKLATADSNVRAMAYVAKEAIKTYENELAKGNLTEEVKADYQAKVSLLNTNYIAKAKDVSYTVKHHYVKADGTETVTDEAKTAKIYADVTATAAANDYFTFDEDNAKNVTAGEAKNGAVLDLYYTQNVQALTADPALLDVDSTTSLTIPESLSTAVTNVVIGGTSVMSALDGTTLTLANVDKLATNGLTTMTYVTDTFAYTQEVDVYTLENFTGESFMKEGTGLVGGVANHYNTPSYIKNEYVGEYSGETNVYKAWTTGYNEAMGMTVMPRHTDEYYAALHTKYASKGLYLYYRFYIEDVSGAWATRSVNDLGAGNMGSLATGEWHTALVNSADYKALMASDKNATFSRMDGLRDKYYYASNTLAIPMPDDKDNWYLGENTSGEADTHNAYCCRGYLVRFGTYNSGAKSTALYVTEPKIVLAENSLLLDLAKVEDATNLKASDLVGGKYPDYQIKALTIDGTAVTMPTENTLLSDYTIGSLTNGAHTVKLTAVNNNYYQSNGYMMYQPITVFNGSIDVYNSNNGLEWHLNISTENAKVYNYTSTKNVLSVVDSTGLPDTDYQASGNYYKVSGTGSDVYSLWTKPAHSLEYYEMMKENGYTAITFDYYVAESTGTIDWIRWGGQSGAAKAGSTGVWATATVSIDVLIADYQYLSTGSYKKADGTYISSGYLQSCIFTVAEWQKVSIEYYVGNFGSVKAN